MQFLADEPEIDKGTAIMVRAYAELSTCRTLGMGIGPIPWTAMVDWCVYHALDRDVADHVIAVLRIVDHETLRRYAAEQRAKNKEK